ncbi:hypothetical protein Aple_057280 [Acrocarpospora pleiomorpha]|uniref:Uncharacterized protein n=2 Tax=Acrocarpospora pleiomorpha TaxID=90975 RepID=A0A5M3XSA3_9ACTN|nr:hypothetical protein Aple_057280 [Acrocarpospora pleiomorpha]
MSPLIPVSIGAPTEGTRVVDERDVRRVRVALWVALGIFALVFALPVAGFYVAQWRFTAAAEERAERYAVLFAERAAERWGSAADPVAEADEGLAEVGVRATAPGSPVVTVEATADRESFLGSGGVVVRCFSVAFAVPPQGGRVTYGVEPLGVCG